jgi:hypothetical protein
MLRVFSVGTNVVDPISRIVTLGTGVSDDNKEIPQPLL